ncbi:MAG TPA: hypothetical protein VFX53_02680 [Pedococcus sp.]|nr:hypothetical protein [Pedococcus sp.]
MSNNTPERHEPIGAGPEDTRPLPSDTPTPSPVSTPARVPASTSAPSRASTPTATTYSPTATTYGPEGPEDVVPAQPEYVRGPYLAPVILGLVCLAIAGLAFAQELGGLTIDWGSVGPLGIVAAGAVLVLLGAIGLVASRRRH